MARALPLPERPPGPGKAAPTARAGSPRGLQTFLSWWIALCLVSLAYNAHQQLAIQGRLLAGAGALEQAVADSRLVSAETNRQLLALTDLERATADLDVKLGRIAAVNGSIRTELEGLGATAEQIGQSVSRMDGQVAQSHGLMVQIRDLSRSMRAILQGTGEIGAEIAQSLDALVEVQEAVGADLAEIERKTRILDRFIGGE